MPRKAIKPSGTASATGDAVILDAYTHAAEPPDPVVTIGTWQTEAYVIRRRDDNQAMLFQHIVDWLLRNPDAEISAVEPGRWERGREVTIYVWRR